MTATGGDGSARAGRVALAVGVVALLVAGLLALVVLQRSGGAEPGPGSGSASGGGRDRTADAAGFDATPRQSITGSARSVVFEGRVLELTSIRLEGAERATAHGTVVDGGGANLGPGQVTVTAPTHITGVGIALATNGLRLRPGQPAIAHPVAGGTPDTSVAGPGPIKIAAREIRFTPAADNAEPRVVGGPVTITDEAPVDVDLDGEQLRWVDPPGTMRLAEPGGSGRATLSWAGGGRVDTGDDVIEAGFLGLKAQRLVGELRTEGGTLRLSGQASLRQVYADGLPRLRTSATVIVKEVRGARAGERAWFRWAPENRGRHDMAITRIAPDSDSATWVNLALDQLPEMCGGEPCPRHGGDTTGLGKRGAGGFLGIGSRSARPIDAVILPGTGDESEVSVDIPPGTPAGEHVVVLTLEGNFEPLRVEIRVPVT